MGLPRLLLAAALALSPVVLASPAHADAPLCIGSPGEVIAWADAFGPTDASSAVCVARGARVVVAYGTSVVAGAVTLEGQLDVGGAATFTSTTITSGSLHDSNAYSPVQVGDLVVSGDTAQPLVGDVWGSTLDVSGTNPAAVSRLEDARFEGACHLGSGTVEIAFLLCQRVDVTRGATVKGYGQLRSRTTITFTAATLVVGADPPIAPGLDELAVLGDLRIPASTPPTEVHLSPSAIPFLGNTGSMSHLALQGPATIDARFVVDDDRYGDPLASGVSLPGVLAYPSGDQLPQPIDVTGSTVESTGAAAWTGQLVKAVPGAFAGDTITFTRCSTAIGWTGPGLSGGGCGVARPVPVVIHQEVLPTEVERPGLTLTPTFKRLRAGQRLTLFGQLTEDGRPLVHQRVVVRELTGGRTWLLKAITTDRSGDWHATLTFTRAGLFSAVTSVATSPAKRVDRVPSAG